MADLARYEYFKLLEGKIYTDFYEKQIPVYQMTHEQRIHHFQEALTLIQKSPHFSVQEKDEFSLALEKYQHDWMRIESMLTDNSDAIKRKEEAGFRFYEQSKMLHELLNSSYI